VANSLILRVIKMPGMSSRRTRFMTARTAVRLAFPLAAFAAFFVQDGLVAADPDGFRPLAQGAIVVVPSDISTDDTIQRGDIPEVTRAHSDRAWQPRQSPVGTTFLERGRNRTYPRDVWCLEFAYKPPRHIDVDVPGPDMKMRRRRLLYMVYRVRNVGGRRSVERDDPLKRLTREAVEKPIRFLPHFVLESIEGLSADEGRLAYRGYLDRVVPSAVEPIRRREAVPGRLYDSASMVETEIQPGESRWGVAVWENIDPRIDYFSIFIRGLTNAIRWRVDPQARFTADGPPGLGTEHALESLRLDFWSPSDEADHSEDAISVGHAGMLERMAIGTRVLETVGRTRLTNASPIEGLSQLGLAWRDLLDVAGQNPAGQMIDRDAAPSLAPFAKVLGRLAAVPEPTARGPLVRDLFGDLGVEWIEALSRGLAAPSDPEHEAARTAALAAVGVAAEDLQKAPLESLARVVAALDRTTSGSIRREQATALFGPAASRLEALVGELANARALAVLHDFELDRRSVVAGGPRNAFDHVRTAVELESDPAKRARILEGLLGPEGPALFTAATAVHEGIDHAWVFRYENDLGVGL